MCIPQFQRAKGKTSTYLTLTRMIFNKVAIFSNFFLFLFVPKIEPKSATKRNKATGNRQQAACGKRRAKDGKQQATHPTDNVQHSTDNIQEDASTCVMQQETHGTATFRVRRAAVNRQHARSIVRGNQCATRHRRHTHKMQHTSFSAAACSKATHVRTHL